MIERFFEYLINKLYWEFRKENNLPFGTFNPESVIKFGGFVLEEPYWNEEKKRVEVRRMTHPRTFIENGWYSGLHPNCLPKQTFLT